MIVAQPVRVHIQIHPYQHLQPLQMLVALFPASHEHLQTIAEYRQTDPQISVQDRMLHIHDPLMPLPVSLPCFAVSQQDHRVLSGKKDQQSFGLLNLDLLGDC